MSKEMIIINRLKELKDVIMYDNQLWVNIKEIDEIIDEFEVKE